MCCGAYCRNASPLCEEDLILPCNPCYRCALLATLSAYGAQVSATIRAVNLAEVEAALTSSDAATTLDAALRQQIGSTLTAGTLKVTSPLTQLP